MSDSYPIDVNRLLILILCALGLAFAPVAANAAALSSGNMADCAMGKNMPKPINGKMDCCVPACQSTAPALAPEKISDGAAPLVDRSQLSWTPVKELSGITSSGLDPPPRLLS